MIIRWLSRGGVRMTLTLALMALIVLWVGPVSIWSTIKTSRPLPLLLSLLFTPGVIGIKTLRWLLLARTQGHISFSEALCSYLAGLALATLTPMAAGEAGRGLFVRTGDRARLTGIVLLDKMVDLSTVSTFAGLGLILTEEPVAQIIGTAIFASVIVAGSAMLFLLPKLERLVTGAKTGKLTHFRVVAIVGGLIDVPLPQLVLNVGLSLAGFIVFYGQAYVLLLSFWPAVPWTVITYFPIITLSTILPIAIGGVGIREWTAIILLRQFGVAESVAFNTFFVHFVVVQLLPALAGMAIIGVSGDWADDLPGKRRVR